VVRDRFAAALGVGVVRGAGVVLAGAARAALVGAGVSAKAVQVVGACTSCDAGRLYSYRRDGATCGRQAGVVWALAPEGPR
jgi:copper oxidase (laccase) domain-containing protein